MENHFYGIEDIQFIHHGDWNDPELIYHNHSYNYYLVENALWDLYRESIDGKPNENDFAIWVGENADCVRDILRNLMENDCFYEAS